MTPEERAAFLNTQAVAAMIKAMGMQAENKGCEMRGETMLYGEEAFNDLIDEFGIGYNAATSYLRGL